MAESLEHVALFIQDRRNGVACVAIELESPSELRNRQGLAWNEKDERPTRSDENNQGLDAGPN